MFSPIINLTLLCLTLFISPAWLGQGQAAPPEQDAPAPQIMLVIDVSDSMEEFVIPDNAPADLRDLSDRIAAIETNPEYIRLREAMDAILNDPTVASLQQARHAAADTLDKWLAGINFDDAQAYTEVNQILRDNGCQESATSIVYADNLARVDKEIRSACPQGIAEETRQQIKNKMAFLDNPEYQALVQADKDARKRFTEASDALGYAQLSEQFEARVAETGMSKRLGLTQLAALTLVDLSRLDTQSAGRESPLGLVTFSTTATLIQPFTTAYDQLAQNINTLGLQQATNIGEGLRLGLEQLAANATPGQPSALILFSDGKTNRGLAASEVLAQYGAVAAQAGVKICTVGFGNNEAELDAELLKGLAEATGGQYLLARSGEELAAFFLDCRQGLIYDIAGRFTGAVKQGESIEVGQFDIGEDVGAFTLTLNYLNGDVATELVDPRGDTLAVGSPNVTVQQGEKVQLITVSDALPDTWTVRVTANQAPATGLVYNILLTTEQRPTPTPAPPTDTPTHTPTPLPTNTPSPTPTDTATATSLPPTSTATAITLPPTSTATSVPVATPTPATVEQSQPGEVKWGLWGGLGLLIVLAIGAIIYFGKLFNPRS